MKRIRNSSLRTVYEDVTRKIRFAFYRHFDCPIILGHNQDDCFENVFSNLGKQIHYENLFGMQEVGEEQGVQILRPMLEIPKKRILAFADKNGIPHLYDSTPAWSRRGQMRDTLIPGIQTFDSQILVGLSEFVKHSRFLESNGIDRSKNGFQTSVLLLPLPLQNFRFNYQEIHSLNQIFRI